MGWNFEVGLRRSRPEMDRSKRNGVKDEDEDEAQNRNRRGPVEREIRKSRRRQGGCRGEEDCT